MTDKDRASSVIIPASILEAAMGAMRASILRHAESQAPEGRARGAELQSQYLALSAAIDRHLRLVDLWGWELEPAVPQPLPAPSLPEIGPHLVSAGSGS